MDKKTEGQRVWVITWLVCGGMRVQLQGCWDAKPESFPTNAPSTPCDAPLGPGGSWINPFSSLVLSSLMCKMGGAAVGDIRVSHHWGWGDTRHCHVLLMPRCHWSACQHSEDVNLSQHRAASCYIILILCGQRPHQRGKVCQGREGPIS